MATKFEMTPAWKGTVTKWRNEAMSSAPARVECPKCGQTRIKQKFGVRTFKDSTGKPTRAAMQSFCTDCRNQPAKNPRTPKAEKPAPAPRAKATPKVRKEGRAKVKVVSTGNKVLDRIRVAQSSVGVTKEGVSEETKGPKVMDISEFDVMKPGSAGPNWLDSMVTEGRRNFVTDDVAAAPEVVQPAAALAAVSSPAPVAEKVVVAAAAPVVKRLPRKALLVVDPKGA